MPKTKKIRKYNRSLKRKNIIKKSTTKTMKNKKVVGGYTKTKIKEFVSKLKNIIFTF